ncbi:MAG: helicase HerA-like domain-containing protein, partial [Gammaproteobacteria bacterium]
SRIGPASPEERRQILERSPLRGKYDQAIDRASAHEHLLERARQAEAAAATAAPETRSRAAPASRRQSTGEAFAKSVARSIGSSLGRQILRGVLGAIFKGR